MKNGILLSISLLLVLSFPTNNTAHANESKTVEPIPYVFSLAQSKMPNINVLMPPKTVPPLVVISPNEEAKAEPVVTTDKAPVVETPKQTEGRTVTFVATAYTAHDGDENGKGITASGTHVKANRTAACPKSISFGTKLYIPSLDSTLTCEDRGGAIKEGRLDIYIPSKKEAMSFGRQKIEVIILSK